MVKVIVKAIDVEQAEYISPRHDSLRVITTTGQHLVFDRQQEPEVFSAMEGTADLKIMAFGERQAAEDKKLRELAQQIFKEEMMKIAEAKAQEKINADEAALLAREAMPKAEAVVVAPGVATVNKESSEELTVGVVMPAAAAPIMKMEVVATAQVPDKASIDPQIEVKLTPVVEKAETDVVVEVATKPEEAANLKVVVSEEDVARLKPVVDGGTDIIAAVEKAVEVVAPVLPAKAEEVADVPVATPVVEEPAQDANPIPVESTASDVPKGK